MINHLFQGIFFVDDRVYPACFHTSNHCSLKVGCVNLREKVFKNTLRTKSGMVDVDTGWFFLLVPCVEDGKIPTKKGKVGLFNSKMLSFNSFLVGICHPQHLEHFWGGTSQKNHHVSYSKMNHTPISAHSAGLVVPKAIPEMLACVHCTMPQALLKIGN